jgi:hypothetical protein
MTTSHESPLFVKQLRQAGHVIRFSIFSKETGGWEVKEESGTQVLKQVRLSDWHRVERAREVFSLKALSLQEAGWVEDSLSPLSLRRTFGAAQ